MKFLSTGHALNWWDQVQARRERKGKGKYMGQESRLQDKFLDYTQSLFQFQRVHFA